MISDIERKVFRILVNCSLHNRIPGVRRLCIWTGRGPKGIEEILSSLAEKKYIKWAPNNPDEIELLTTEERREWQV